MELTDIDRKIIEILHSNGRTPYTEIAKRLKISEGTVRKRVTRLTENQVIQIVGLIDPVQLGFNAPAMIGVSIDPPQIDAAAKEIATFSEVSYLIMVSGVFDLIVEVLCRDRADLVNFLNTKLHQVPGVNDTQTFLTLQTYKMAYGARPMVER